jgi:DinB superfamily
MAAPQGTPTRRRAIAILQEGHAAVMELYERLPARARTRPGLGGGAWSPKDLIGHLETWEAFALQALDAWAEGHGPAFERELWTVGTSRINGAEVERKRSRSAPQMVRRAEATHAELLGRLGAIGDAAWRRPGSPRGRKPMGERLGGILGGPAGPFRHAEAHLGDLRAFAEASAPGRDPSGERP